MTSNKRICVVCEKIKKQNEMFSIEVKKNNVVVVELKDYCIDCKGTKKLCKIVNKNGCNKLKGLGDFTTQKGCKYDRFTYCNECRGMIKKSKNNPRIEKGSIIHCSGCNMDLEESKFDTDTGAKNGLQGSCKKCKIKMEINRKSSFDGFVNKICKDFNDNAKKYNINIEITSYNIVKLYDDQNGKCKLTGKIMTWDFESKDDKESNRNKFPYNMSIMRDDNKKTCTKENIHLICSYMNVIKYSFSTKVLDKICVNTVLNNLDKYSQQTKSILIKKILELDQIDSSLGNRYNNALNDGVFDEYKRKKVE
jgi:hypothetical protein